ncbi:MAG: hypothetical protein AVDCRST_MAG12-884, partial [uncultured Rubrobacteraceae bacterium]
APLGAAPGRAGGGDPDRLAGARARVRGRGVGLRRGSFCRGARALRFVGLARGDLPGVGVDQLVRGRRGGRRPTCHAPAVLRRGVEGGHPDPADGGPGKYCGGRTRRPVRAGLRRARGPVRAGLPAARPVGPVPAPPAADDGRSARRLLGVLVRGRPHSRLPRARRAVGRQVPRRDHEADAAAARRVGRARTPRPRGRRLAHRDPHAGLGGAGRVGGPAPLLRSLRCRRRLRRLSGDPGAVLRALPAGRYGLRHQTPGLHRGRDTSPRGGPTRPL